MRTNASEGASTGTIAGPCAMLFDSFGPYHFARLRAANQRLPVLGIEVAGQSEDYPWYTSVDSPSLIQLFPGMASQRIDPREMRAAVFGALDRVQPAAVAIPGYSLPSALHAFSWCARNRRPAIMMCESTAIDARRGPVVESLKRAIVSSCAAGFAGGSRSKAYLQELGLPAERISVGYDVVDNDHFRDGAREARAAGNALRERLGLPDSYAVFVGRLIEKKNVEGLIRGYAAYCERIGPDRATPLVIAGGGPLEAELRALAQQLAVADRVTFAGHVDYQSLPALYGLARCFVLASTEEQWGLVANEAIASGLPLLISDRCGAAGDLLDAGVNGFAINPGNPESIADGLQRVCHEVDIEAFGRESDRIAAGWGLPLFGEGFEQAVRCATEAPRYPRYPAALLAALLAHPLLPRKSDLAR